MTLVVCDICGKTVSIIGSHASSYIGLGDNVVHACNDCITATGEFLADRQDVLMPKAITNDFIPAINFAEARRKRDETKLAESEVTVAEVTNAD
jgi:hypothetical protein